MNNKEINSQCAELLARPTYITKCTVYNIISMKVIIMYKRSEFTLLLLILTKYPQ